MTTNTPPPGSAKAVALLCTCPVLDNGHGRGYRYLEGEPTLFIVMADCPLHGSTREAVSPDGEKDDEEKEMQL